jgi:hypothetical protein
MSDGGGIIGPTISAVNAQAPAQQATNTGAAYTPIKQGPVYQPDYQRYQPQIKSAQPQYQQMPDYQSGLQSAMMQLMQQYSRPAMREPIQQGLTPYRSPALNYRPDMSGITANLSRVAPSVAEQQRLQAIEDARIAAEKAAAEEKSSENVMPGFSGSWDGGGG